MSAQVNGFYGKDESNQGYSVLISMNELVFSFGETDVSVMLGLILDHNLPEEADIIIILIFL